MKTLTLILLLIASPAWAAPIEVDIDRNVNLQLGQKNFGPIAIPDDVSFCRIAIDRSEWTNPAATLDAKLFISVSNGPFEFWAGVASYGTPVEAQVPVSSIGRNLPAGTSRKVQGNYVVAGARFRSTITVACE